MITSVRFCLSYDILNVILSPSKVDYFIENLHCCHGRQQNVGPDLDPNCLTHRWYSCINFSKKHSKLVHSTVKPVLSDHLKIDKTKVLMKNGSLTKVESIAECSKGSILQYF